MRAAGEPASRLLPIDSGHVPLQLARGQAALIPFPFAHKRRRTTLPLQSRTPSSAAEGCVTHAIPRRDDRVYGRAASL